MTNGLAPTREMLPNGVVILTKETRTTPAVAINAAIQAGSAFDPPAQAGLAHFVSRVIDRGTARRSAESIATEFDDRGVALTVSVSRELMTLACNCLADDFEAVLSVIADIVRDASCPDVEIDRRRGEIITAIQRDAESPFASAYDSVMELLYGPAHPYGRRAKGDVETVSRLQRSSLRAFHRWRFVPQALSLAIVGDVRASVAVAAAGRALRDWPDTPATPVTMPEMPARGERRRVAVALPGKVQADIAYGFTAIARTDPRYDAFWIMNNVFGQYGLGGRLGDSIRERQGMAYYVFSSLDANRMAGPLLVRAGVNPENVERAVRSIDAEVERMAAQGVTEQELADSQQFLIGSIPRMLETNASTAAFLQTIQRFNLGLDYDVRLPDLLGSVTRDAVRSAAEATLSPDRAAIAIAGPVDASPAPGLGC